jgi:hypothetical protein
MLHPDGRTSRISRTSRIGVDSIDKSDSVDKVAKGDFIARGDYVAEVDYVDEGDSRKYCRLGRHDKDEFAVTCLTLDQQVNLAIRNGIPESLIDEIVNDNKIDLIEKKKRMKNLLGEFAGLKRETDFIATLPVYDRKKVYKPLGSTHYMQWLSNFNIDDKLEEFRNYFPNFIYFRTTTMDFEDLEGSVFKPEMIDNLYTKYGYTKFAAVFNTSYSHQAGKHWVAIFIDMSEEPYKFYYYDSVANSVPVEIDRFAKKLKKYFDGKFRIKMALNTCGRRAQFGNSECGVYCIDFIFNLLNGKAYDEYCKLRKSDREMNYLRHNLYFIDPKEVNIDN